MWIYKDSNNKTSYRKYVKNMRNNQFLKVKNSHLALKKKLWNWRIENWKIELKTLRYIEELFYKPIMVSKDDMDKFEEQEMKKIRTIKKNGMNG